ncbi:MAG: hypothetical protein K0S61_735 [Anaerocolumna sp.]|jgi:hypothetical protein|nr:hypothetical protein [Anaerocolumna sp.]
MSRNSDYVLIVSQGENVKCEICDKTIKKGESYWLSKTNRNYIGKTNMFTGHKKNYATCEKCKFGK